MPRIKRSTWNIGQIQRFLLFAKEDRFFALWVLELTTGMRRCEVDTKALSRRVGHASMAFTMEVYGGEELDDDRKVADTMAQLILPAVLGPRDPETGEE